MKAGGKVYRYAGLLTTTAWDLAGSLATFEAEGVLTDAAVPAVLADCQRDLEASAAVGLLADYRGVDLRIDASRLCASAVAVINKGGHLALPTALLVTPDTHELWRRYAGLMAQAGVVRGAFTCAVSARQWAQDQAQVWAMSRAVGRPAGPS